MKRFFIIMFVCACALFGFVGNIEAQIKIGDIVTIKNGNNYLGVNSNATAIENITAANLENSGVRALWKVTNAGNTFSFVSLFDISKGLRVNNNNNLSLTATGSEFTFSGTNANGSNVANGTLKYSDRYIRFNYTWSTNKNNATQLTIEKWELKTVAGGLEGKFEAGDVDFRWAENDAMAAGQSITRTFTVTSSAAKTYYDCLNTADVEQVGLTESDASGTPKVTNLRFSLTNKGQYNCAIYTDATVKNRTLVTISYVKDNTKTNTWNVTITPEGSSPMELQDADSWIDFTDEIVAAFQEEGDDNENTYRTYFPIKRRSYHREALPEFVVTVTPGNHTFPKDTELETTFTVECKHQHGEEIKHMFGFLTGNNFDKDDVHTYATVDEDLNVTNSFANFSAKNISDQTTASWLTVGELSDGQITLRATANDTASTRKARFVGVFNYVNPNDETDTHFTSIEIPIIQRYKDGKTVLVPNKGHSGDALVKQPYLENEYEQQVHTVNKTIYYLPGQNIELRLQENSFRKYIRWYDYETGCNPVYNANATDRTTWATPPKTGNTNFLEINNTNGDSYGLYSTNNKGNLNPNIPILKGWTDGKAHVMACDVSAHTDYTIGDDTIIEPTLSYRQVFHLKPAAEMANKLCSLSQAGKYLESYKYMVPTNQVLMLSTAFRYFGEKANHETECCYFYTKNSTPTRITSGCKWYKDDVEVDNVTYGTKDYLQVAAVATAGTTATYQLRLPKNVSGLGYDLLIAEFQVTYVDNATHGPVNSKTGGNEIKSYADIAAHYQILEFNDFSFGAPAPGTNTANQHSGKRLPWSDATYGFYYPNLGDCDRQNSGQGDIPYYGEYALINYMQGGGNNGWGKGEQHGGASNGYALYVDGTQEPGLVASISTKAEICSGQTMYCSMWLMNPRSGSNNDAVNPIFRCNIQGRHSGNTEWEDAGVYYVGEVGRNNHLGTGWQQIVFPVKSDISYDETRVQIYNFGTGGMGNDFLVDDLCLYASPLPLATYHETTGCTSYSDSKTTSTVVVVRIDYSQLQELNTTAQVNSRSEYVYYQIVDVTTADSIILQLKDANDQPMYHTDFGEKNLEYGSIAIPQEVVESLKKTSVEDLIKDLTKTNIASSGKCFVQDKVTGQWFLYLVQIIPNGDEGDRDKYLDRDRSYILRVSYNAAELRNAACVFTSPLLAKQDTYLELRNEKVGTQRVTSCLDDLCANNHHFLDVKVSNAISATVGGAMQTYESLVHADWLRGFKEDDAYCNGSDLTSDEQEAADAAFLSNYGYSRSAVKNAIVAMRKMNGLNYTVSDADNLQVDGDFGEDDLALIRDLCGRGLLLLYQQTTMFYLGSKASARYWVYPVAEDATVTVNGNTVTLQDCDEPQWIKLTSAESEYGVNLSPIDLEKLTEHQRLDIPTIRVIEGTKEVTIPIKNLVDETQVNSSLSATGEYLTFNVHNPTEGVLEYIDLSNNRIEIQDAPSSFVAGQEYLMRMAFYDKAGHVFIEGDTTQCRVGYVYFYLMFAPRENTWTGAKSAIWGDDRNWSGGCAPLPETDVIIPVMPVDKPYPVVTVENKYPLDVNYKSNACNRIYFESGATILNQHLLDYKRAFVDMLVPATEWNTMAAPMKGMHTGDIFIPHNFSDFSVNTNKESTEPFVVSEFQGARTSSAPYAFWQSFYNKRVYTQHENGNASSALSTNTAAFAPSNSLDQKLTPGMGFQVLGYGPTNESSEQLIVRLPKPDNKYYYYYNNGTKSDQQVSVSHSSELAFEPDANGNMKITLENAQASVDFMFGNPTMAYIDMKAFLETNASVLEGAYYTMTNGTWDASTKEITSEHSDGLLAPMRSVLVKAKSSSNKITVTLSASHLRHSDGTAAPISNGAAQAPRRKTDDVNANVMTIYAYNESGQARCTLVDNPYAENKYISEEDVLFISSGIEQEVIDGTAYSPINMYTVADRVPMMVDIRQEIDTVPIAMLIMDDDYYKTEQMTLAFYLSINWDKECYFEDSQTGKKIRIMDGTIITIDTPDNHDPRYFITGPDMRSDNDDNVTTSTTNPSKPEMDAEINIWAYSPEQGKMVVTSNDIIKAVNIYDPSGRLIAQKTLDLQYNSTAVNIPAGVYIVEATMRDNSKKFTQAIVW